MSMEYFNAKFSASPRLFWQFGYETQRQSLHDSRRFGTLFQILVWCMVLVFVFVFEQVFCSRGCYWIRCFQCLGRDYSGGCRKRQWTSER
jgi:hypothetical protein